MKRFEQLKSLYKNMLSDFSEHQNNRIFIVAITSSFDQLFELSWKVLKEYLFDDLGIREAKTGSPKEIIKLAYNHQLIDDERFWLTLLKERNDDAHHYSESEARAYAARIEHNYLPSFANFMQTLYDLIPEEQEALIKIPESLLEASEQSKIGYDAFMTKVKLENSLENDLEVIKNWDNLKHKYYLVDYMSAFDDNHDL